MRKILMLAAVLGALAFVPAHADTWCPSGYPGGETDVILFSGPARVVVAEDVGTAPRVNPGIAGCTATDGSGDPLYNTDYVVPGSTILSARWMQPTEPTGGTLSVTGIVVTDCGSGMQTGNSCSLNWHIGDPADPGYWDSQIITVDQASTLSGGTATVSLTYPDVEGPGSQSHTYRTVG